MIVYKINIIGGVVHIVEFENNTPIASLILFYWKINDFFAVTL